MNVSRITKTVSVAVGTGIATLLNNRKLQRLERERACDLSKLARWRADDEPFKTHDGQFAARRLEAFQTALKASNLKANRLQLELDAMRPVFARIASANTPAEALRNVAATLNNGARSDILCELAERFEAYEKKIHTEGGAKAPESASVSPLPFYGRAVETPPSGVIVGSYDTDLDKWVHGERSHDGRRYLGPCPACGRRTISHGPQNWRCSNAECELHTLALRQELTWWNTDLAVIKEGNMWMARRASFINIQESLCEFAGTPGLAVAALMFTEKHRESMKA